MSSAAFPTTLPLPRQPRPPTQPGQPISDASGSGHLDTLTGLVNRLGWQERLAAEDRRCARYARPSGIVIVDLDGLRRVIDSLGPGAGDDLVLRSADVLRRGSHPWHTVGRMGPDEFAILTPDADRDSLANQVRRLRTLLRIARVPASVGWAVRGPDGGLPASWLAAGRQMYSAKRARRARIVQARGLGAQTGGSAGMISRDDQSG